MKKRCPWAQEDKTELVAYHDTEWGVPLHNDQKHFELLCLEGQQAGLSWELILKKREAYRALFHDFIPEKVTAMTDQELNTIARNPSIIRNKRKVFAIRTNAQAFLKVQQTCGSFDSYIWSFVNNTPIPYKGFQSLSPESIHISKELKKLDFTFVGPKIIYSYMQAAGLISDHSPECFLSQK